MGATSFYAYPYPDPGSTVDVPRDIKALADKLELMKNGLSIPDGNFIVGSSVGPGRSITQPALISGDVVEIQSFIHSSTGNMHWMVRKNAVEMNRLSLAQDGSLQVFHGGQYRPVPYAVAAGQVTLPTSGTVASSATSTYKAGLFTQIPLLIVTPYSGAGAHTGLYQIRTYGGSVTGHTVACNTTAASFGTALSVNYVAMQILPGASIGPTAMMEEREYPIRTVVCRTAGCDNEGIPIELLVPEESLAVSCGPCGQPIEAVGKAKKAKG